LLSRVAKEASGFGQYNRAEANWEAEVNKGPHQPVRPKAIVEKCVAVQVDFAVVDFDQNGQLGLSLKAFKRKAKH
jgi:hypothetical protein